MSSRFLITGLPRSRTAWFAVVAGALHESLSHLMMWPGFNVGQLHWPEGVGLSDSGAALFLEELVQRFAPRTLIIERPMNEVRRSFAAYMAGYAYSAEDVDYYLNKLQIGLGYQHPLVMRVRYDALTSLAVMQECMDWLGVTPVNLEQAMHMRIETDLAWNLAKLEKDAA